MLVFLRILQTTHREWYGEEMSVCEYVCCAFCCAVCCVVCCVMSLMCYVEYVVCYVLCICISSPVRLYDCMTK